MDGWKKNLIDIKPYVPGEQPKEKNIVKINANENPYPPSPEVTKAIREFDPSKLRFYPDACATELKSTLAEHYGVKGENVFVGNGSDDVLALCFQAFFNAALPVLYPDITYSFYPVWSALFGVKYSNPELDGDFRICADDYCVPNGGIIIPNPNAPTSLGEGEEFFRKIMSSNTDSVVIIDEAYADFGEYSAVALTKEFENLLVCGTLSKSRSLAGLRVGFAVGSEALISTLEAVKNSYNSYTVNSISLAAAAQAVKDEEYFKKTVEKIKITRKRTVDALRKMGFFVFDSQANFLLITHDDVNAEELFNYLKENKIFVRYFNVHRLENHLRVTIGTDEEMDKFINCTKQFLNR